MPSFEVRSSPDGVWLVVVGDRVVSKHPRMDQAYHACWIANGGESEDWPGLYTRGTRSVATDDDRYLPKK